MTLQPTDLPLPSLPKGVVQHAQVGELYDQMQVHQYAMRYAELCLEEQAKRLGGALNPAAMQDDDHITCPHCGEVTHIGGLVGEQTNDCPRCGNQALTN